MVFGLGCGRRGWRWLAAGFFATLLFGSAGVELLFVFDELDGVTGVGARFDLGAPFLAAGDFLGDGQSVLQRSGAVEVDKTWAHADRFEAE